MSSKQEEEASALNKETISVDMRDNLTTPHSNPSNPFAFTPDQLSALQDPKNISLLHAYGGLNGVSKGLHANIQRGLSAQSTIDSNITLNEIISDQSLIKQSNLNNETNEPLRDDGKPFYQRRAIFGENVLPAVKGKSLLQLMWMAFNDKTLVIYIQILSNTIYSYYIRFY